MKVKTAAVLVSLLILTVASGSVGANRMDNEHDDEPGVVRHFPPVELPQLPSQTGRYDIINSSDASLSLILGRDDREQVTNTSNFPNSSVTLIEAWNNGSDTVFHCTASFVGPNVLLTAAHCLWIPEFDGFPDGVAIAPGANGNATPFGVVAADEIWVPDGWIDEEGDINQAYAYDYGLIVLDDEDLGNEVGAFTVGVLDSADLRAADFNPSTAGYPGDKPYGTQWFGSGDEFDKVYQQVLAHPLDIYFGQSGSPLWRGSDLALVGVISFETSAENFALRITDAVMDELNDACDVLDCAISQFGSGGPDPTAVATPSATATIETPPVTLTPSVEPSPSATSPPGPTPTPIATTPPTQGDLGAFERTWQRTDRPVADGFVNRTWMWGPALTEIMSEPYDESDGSRSVLYHEKSRMEITHPGGDSSSIWYVTNGLLAWELVTGQMQFGDARFEELAPAAINVAGDPDDPGSPTYATFGALLDAAPQAMGTTITATVNRDGLISDDPALATFEVVAAQFVPETNHTVASVFWEFMNAQGLVFDGGSYGEGLLFENPYFATGLPISEPYWTTVRVGGNERTVLVQVFERRVLTYTPGNEPGWEVEAGNVGLHYYAWRYSDR